MKAKKLFLSLFALIMASTTWAANVSINATNFPDANFRNWVLGQTYGADSMLTESEIANVTNIEVNSKNIESLKGIEHFTALKSLSCYYNKLTGLDVSKNTALTNLSCSNNYLTTLDLSGNTSLNYLNCQNNQLTTLNLNACKNLYNLQCYCNKIMGKSMDALVESLPTVSSLNNRYMSVIYSMGGEQNVMTKTQVAAAKAKGWTPLYGYGAAYNWSEYQGSEDPTAGLEINASNFPDENFRSWLLEQEYGTDGVLTDEEIAGIQSISLFNNGIHSLKGIEHFTALTDLYCTLNDLDSLDVSGCTGLTSLNCQVCGLTSLDLSKNTALYRLICVGNELTSLDVSNHSALEYLTCYGNRLTTINLSGCTALSMLDFTSNQIKGAGMDSLVESLPMLVDGSSRWMYVIGSSEDEQNEMTKAQVAAAKAKGWCPGRWAGYDESGWREVWEEYPGIDEDTIPSISVAIDETNFPDANFRNWVLGQTYGADGVLTAEEIAAITYIRVTNLSIRNLKGIEHFTALTGLSCFQNYLTSLDLSKNTALTNVSCFNNRLTSLNVSGCTALTELDCNENQLTRLDVSGCPALTRLYCYKNQIKDSKMDSLIMSLPVVSEGIMNVMFNYNEGNVMTRSQVSAAKAKGWTPKYWDGRTSKWLEYPGSGTETEKCATPTISYSNGKLKFYCETEGARCIATISDTDIRTHYGNEISLTATYNISVYAAKDSCENSDTATATLCWIDAEPWSEGLQEDAVNEIKAQPVLIQAQGSTICVQGAMEGADVSVYDTEGKRQGSAVAVNGAAAIGTSLKPGTIAIVKIGEKAVKVMIR